MASNVENLQQRLNSLYLKLGEQITRLELRRVKQYVYGIIPRAQLEDLDFVEICHSLSSQKKIEPQNHGYLEGLFETIRKPYLWKIVQDFQREQNENSETIPPTWLYNKEATLPIKYRLEEVLKVLETSIGQGRDTIPQQLLYTNAAAGIAGPEKDLTLQLDNVGSDFLVSVPKGTVSAEKVIYCHYVEGESSAYLRTDENLVCYSIPVFLGPPNACFETGHPVVLDIAHKAIQPSNGTYKIKLFVKESNDSKWKEGEDCFCQIKKNGSATILLKHFSEFVIGADPSSATDLPLLKARLDIRVICITETERRLVICLMFDSPFTIKKAMENIGKEVDGLTGKDIQLQPIEQCLIQVSADRWLAKSPVNNVTKQELCTLAFKPIIRAVTMVHQGDHTPDQADLMCKISFMQNSKCQMFVVNETTFQLGSDHAEAQVDSSDMAPIPELEGIITRQAAARGQPPTTDEKHFLRKEKLTVQAGKKDQIKDKTESEAEDLPVIKPLTKSSRSEREDGCEKDKDLSNEPSIKKKKIMSDVQRRDTSSPHKLFRTSNPIGLVVYMGRDVYLGLKIAMYRFRYCLKTIGQIVTNKGVKQFKLTANTPTGKSWTINPNDDKKIDLPVVIATFRWDLNGDKIGPPSGYKDDIKKTMEEYLGSLNN